MIIDGIEYTPVVAIKEELVGRWRPEYGEYYYTINDSGVINTWVYGNQILINGHLALGNIFKTRAEAELECERIKLRVELQDFADECNGRYVGKIEYYYTIALFEGSYIFSWSVSLPLQGPYFNSERDAEDAIAHFGSRLDILK